MFNRMIRFLSGFMVSYGGVPAADLEVYTYGLETLTIRLFHLFTIILLGAFLGFFKEAFLFVIFTFMIRRYSGGFHAKTKLTCYMLSVSTTVASFFYSVLISPRLSAGVQVFLIIVSCAVLMILSPQDYETKRLDALEKQIYGRRARIFLSAITIVSILSVIAGTSAGGIMVGVLLINCIMMIYSYICNLQSK